ncbi:MAG TPA: hypothetical protein DCL54_18965, partial [Alphaproteobacteria bacterium]|nr:hypothetical protein [Alphaproteobacteria bacterium]
QEQAKAAAEALANGTLCSALKSNVVHANGAVQMLDISTDASGTQTSLVCHGGIPVALILSAPDQEPVVIPANAAATGRDTCPQTGRNSVSIPAA